jgi:hypothetical protein
VFIVPKGLFLLSSCSCSRAVRYYYSKQTCSRFPALWLSRRLRMKMYVVACHVIFDEKHLFIFLFHVSHLDESHFTFNFLLLTWIDLCISPSINCKTLVILAATCILVRFKFLWNRLCWIMRVVSFICSTIYALGCWCKGVTILQHEVW